MDYSRQYQNVVTTYNHTVVNKDNFAIYAGDTTFKTMSILPSTT